MEIEQTLDILMVMVLFLAGMVPTVIQTGMAKIMENQIAVCETLIPEKTVKPIRQVMICQINLGSAEGYIGWGV